MLMTTTHSLQGRDVAEYLGVVTGQTIYGANVFRDFFASIRDIVGGRSGAYESVLRDGAQDAMADLQRNARDLGANAVLGIAFDYEAVGKGGSMLLVAVSGTAVRLR